MIQNPNRLNMMRNFTNEDFDEFLKRSTDEFRMRPSLKVWKNISGQLRERRRRLFFTTIGFVLLTGMVGYYIFEGTEQLKNPATVQTKNTVTPAEPQLNRDPGQSPVVQEQTETASQLPNSFEVPVAVAIASRPRQMAQAQRTTEITREENTTPVDEIQANLPETEIVTPIADSDPTLAEPSTEPAKTEIRQEQPGTIESVTNLYQRLPGNSKLAFQVFVTPTVSYRKLSENKGYSPAPAGGGTNYPAIYNINDAVTHKPDMGLELGVTAKYALDKNVKLRGGLQFNVSRYDIKAFTYTNELATIALGRNGSGSVDYVDQVSGYRNFSGNRPDWLQNMYFQVSAPMGIELKLRGNDKASFGVASSLQPSYMLGERAYMLSTDYKNYTRVPQLVRRWNVATNLETFVTYSTGQVKWQVGPQMRYQLLSSFVSEYPVKEHLFDFGLKVGMSLNKKKTQSDTK